MITLWENIGTLQQDTNENKINLHCPKNNLTLLIKTKPVMEEKRQQLMSGFCPHLCGTKTRQFYARDSD